jgi:hypothetical protein
MGKDILDRESCAGGEVEGKSGIGRNRMKSDKSDEIG